MAEQNGGGEANIVPGNIPENGLNLTTKTEALFHIAKGTLEEERKFGVQFTHADLESIFPGQTLTRSEKQILIQRLKDENLLDENSIIINPNEPAPVKTESKNIPKNDVSTTQTEHSVEKELKKNVFMNIQRENREVENRLRQPNTIHDGTKEIKNTIGDAFKEAENGRRTEVVIKNPEETSSLVYSTKTTLGEARERANRSREHEEGDPRNPERGQNVWSPEISKSSDEFEKNRASEKNPETPLRILDRHRDIKQLTEEIRGLFNKKGYMGGEEITIPQLLSDLEYENTIISRNMIREALRPIDHYFNRTGNGARTLITEEQYDAMNRYRQQRQNSTDQEPQTQTDGPKQTLAPEQSTETSPTVKKMVPRQVKKVPTQPQIPISEPKKESLNKIFGIQRDDNRPDKSETDLERTMREATENVSESLKNISSFRTLRTKLEELRDFALEARKKNPLDLNGGLANKYTKYIEAVDELNIGAGKDSEDFYTAESVQAIQDLKDNPELLGIALKLFNDKRSYFLDVENGSHKGFVQSFEDREKAKEKIRQKEDLENDLLDIEDLDDEPPLPPEPEDLDELNIDDIPEAIPLANNAEGPYEKDLHAIADARKKYGVEYSAWIATSRKQGAINRIKNTLGLNLKSDHTKYITEKEEDLPIELKLARANWNQARKNLFDKMATDKESELRAQLITGDGNEDQIQKLLKEYKSIDLVNELIIKQQQAFVDEQVEQKKASSKILFGFKKAMKGILKINGKIGVINKSILFGGAALLTGGGALVALGTSAGYLAAAGGSIAGGNLTGGAHELFTRGSRKKAEDKRKADEKSFREKLSLDSSILAFENTDAGIKKLTEDRAEKQRKHLVKKAVYVTLGGLAAGGGIRYANSAGILDSLMEKIDPDNGVELSETKTLPAESSTSTPESIPENTVDVSIESKDIPTAIPVETDIQTETISANTGEWFENIDKYEVSAEAGRHGEWGIIEEILEKQGILKDGTPPGIRTHMIDQFYNKVEELSRIERLAIGLGPNMGDVRTGATVDMSGIFSDSDRANLINESINISEAKQSQIIRNDALLDAWAKQNPGRRLTADLARQIINRGR